jgi:drug/metabolite transporter (DMT)-like permease
MSNTKTWLGFWLLALIWGSSYLFIRIGVDQVPPFQLVFMRTAIAAIGLTAIVFLKGHRLPRDRWSIFDLIFLGIINIVLPFMLITWGETRIESSLASILTGTTVLFASLVAHFTFADERISYQKAVGLIVGFSRRNSRCSTLDRGCHGHGKYWLCKYETEQ